MNSLHHYLLALGFKATNTANEYLADECWHCGGQHKLYFNVKKLIGYCLKCTAVVDLKALVSESGGNTKDMKSLLESLDTIQREADIASMGFKDAVFTRLSGGAIQFAIGSELPEASLPDEFRMLKESHKESITARQALSYLEGRGFKIKTLFSMGFGYCATGYYGGRVIIPFKEGGKLVYWQARDFTGRHTKDKVLNPPKAMVATGKSEVLFNYDVARNEDVVIVCESWGSALAVGHYAVGLNGKDLSDTQLEKLKACKADRFIIMLDHGAEDKAWEAAEKLSATRRVFVASLPYGDPNEVPRSIVLDAIRNCEPYSRLARIKALTRILN